MIQPSKKCNKAQGHQVMQGLRVTCLDNKCHPLAGSNQSLQKETLTTSNPAAKTSRSITEQKVEGRDQGTAAEVASPAPATNFCPWVAQEEGHCHFPVCHLALGASTTPLISPRPSLIIALPAHQSSTSLMPHLQCWVPNRREGMFLSPPSFSSRSLQGYHGNRSA